MSGVKLFSPTLRILTKVSLVLPPPSEQLRIANHLDAKQSMADKLREYRRSRLKILKR